MWRNTKTQLKSHVTIMKNTIKTCDKYKIN